MTVGLEELFDFVEHRLFGLVVACAELFCAFEHQVLEIVRKAGGFGGVVLSAYANGDICLNTGLVLVDGHKDLKSVWQGVHFGLQGVVGHGLEFVLGCRQWHSHEGQRCKTH